MAQNNSNARPTFYEVVFQGKPKVVRAFIAGMILGTGTEAKVYYSFTDGIQHEGKAEKLAEKLHFRATDCHVVVDSAASKLLKKHARRPAEKTGLEITAHNRIKSASVRFCYQAFAPRYDDEVVKLVRKLPKGLKLEDFQHDVKVDPKAKGVEAYSVAHHYEATGGGVVTGRADLVIELKKKFADYPLIRSDDVVLELA
jgi:hypothetical protein